MSSDYLALPRIPRESIRLLWVDDYYDAPLIGMLVVDGRLHRYEICDEGRYIIRALTDEDLAEEEDWHALFVEHVGDHWDYRADGERRGVRPPSEHAKFYDPYNRRAPRDYSTRPIIGWFEL